MSPNKKGELRKKLLQTCNMSIEDFSRLPDFEHHNTPHGLMSYQDNGGKILAVGHLDWVLFTKAKFNRKKTRIFCPQLDDRLGIWTILHYFPELLRQNGIHNKPYDILLCDEEETGNSTAQYFADKYPDKVGQYNWLFEFDRAGTDVVTYQYDMEEWEKELKEYYTVVWGAFSDICSLDDLEVCAVNIGVGYHQAHSHKCYANMGENSYMAERFVKFYDKHYDRKFKFDKAESSEYGYRGYYGGYGSSYGSGGYLPYNPDVGKETSDTPPFDTNSYSGSEYSEDWPESWNLYTTKCSHCGETVKQETSECHFCGYPLRLCAM